MEQQMDTLKVYKHYQHARLQNEGDDMWISSEDLRTEGSSDEDTQHKSLRNTRSKKQRKSDLLLSTSNNTSSFFPKSSGSVELPTKDRGCSSDAPTEKPSLEQSRSFNPERCVVAGSPFLPDVFLESGPSTSGISLGSTDSDMDALNLESRWRPKRGSLKYPTLVEGQTTNNYVHEVDGFYNEMMSKLKMLRNCPALRQKEVLDEVEAKTFKHLKCTPAVKEKLKIIEKFDSDIKETIEVYKKEKMQRLETQNEMCDAISKNNEFSYGQLFLELCHFEDSDSNTNIVEVKEPAAPNQNSTEKVSNSHSNTAFANNFIKRNIELAKEGIMAGCSLTDEEKRKLDDLLAEHEGPYSLGHDYVDVSMPRAINVDYSPETEDDDDECDNYYISNAYVIHDEDQQRIGDINTELEKFTVDEAEQEKTEDGAPKYDRCDWNSVLMEQRMKNIDAKLSELYKSYEDDEFKDDESKYDESKDDDSKNDEFKSDKHKDIESKDEESRAEVCSHDIVNDLSAILDSDDSEK